MSVVSRSRASSAKSSNIVAPNAGNVEGPPVKSREPHAIRPQQVAERAWIEPKNAPRSRLRSSSANVADARVQPLVHPAVVAGEELAIRRVDHGNTGSAGSDATLSDVRPDGPVLSRQPPIEPPVHRRFQQ